MNTTLNAIRKHSPCEDGWAKLLTHLSKTKADDEPLPLFTILDSNGLDDALWALRAVEGHDCEIQLFACACAKRVLMKHYEALRPDDKRPREAINTAIRYAKGKATKEEMESAVWSARSVRSAAWSARSAWSAARSAWSAAESAWSAVWSVWSVRSVRSAVRSAVWSAAEAAEESERKWQTAAFRKMARGRR